MKLADPVRSPGRLALIVLAVGLASLPAATSSLRAAQEDPGSGGDGRDRLTAEERRGKEIYLRGVSSSGRKITALFGDARIEIPASALTCASCHGHDGTGKPEGGIVPSDITWDALTKPYGVKHRSGREHAPYDERSLRRAVTQGLDPAGQSLATSMPVYRLTHEEADELVAYLKRLGHVKEPGLEPDVVRIGCVLPAEATPIRSVLAGYFDDLNEAGGIHGRSVELRFADAGATPDETVAAVRALLAEDDVFALVGTTLEGAEERVAALLRQAEVPLIGGLTDFPALGHPLNRYVFYLLAGVPHQAAALVQYAAQTAAGNPPRSAIVWAGDGRVEAVAGALASRCTALGWPDAEVMRLSAEPSEMASELQRLRDAGVDALFLLGPGVLQGAVMREASRLEWKPRVYVPGPFADEATMETASSFAGDVFLSFPRGPNDQSAQAVSEFVDFLRRHELPSDALPDYVAAYCTASVLAEALKRSGRDVNRDELTETVEGFYAFETGLMPEVTFGPNRRVGARGAYVARLDAASKQLVPVSDWLENGAVVVATIPTPAATTAKAAAPAASGAQAVEAAADPDEEDCESETERDLVATCNGIEIRLAQVDARVADALAALHDSLHRTRARGLDVSVNSWLLEREAKARGQTTIELLKDEVVARVTAPTEAEARAFYEENKARLPGGFGPNRTPITRHLGQERERDHAKRFADELRAAADVVVLTEGLSLGDPSLAPLTPLAMIDGEPMTLAAVDRELDALVAYVEEESHALRRDALNGIIEELLLAEEATRRSLTVQALLEAEVLSAIRVVTDDDGRAFFEANRERMDADFDDPEGRLQILDYLRRQEEQRARSAFTDRLREAADVHVYLVSPRAADERLAADGQPGLGPDDAPVTVVAFLDFACTKCGDVQRALRGLVDELAGSVRLVVRDFPLDMHPEARTAALAAEAAREQGRYWEYAELLFANQTELGSLELGQYADQLGLDRRRFDDALATGKFSAELERDQRDGISLGVYSTPTVFVAGRRVADETHPALKAAIEQALRDAQESER